MKIKRPFVNKENPEFSESGFTPWWDHSVKKRQSLRIIYKHIASLYHIYKIEADNYSRTEVNLKVLVNILTLSLVRFATT